MQTVTHKTILIREPLFGISFRIAASCQLSQGPHELLRRGSIVVIHITRTHWAIRRVILVAVIVVWVAHRTVVVVEARNDPFRRFVAVRIVTRFVAVVSRVVVIAMIVVVVSTASVVILVIVGIITSLAVAVVSISVGSVGRRIARVLFAVVTALPIIVLGFTVRLWIPSCLAIGRWRVIHFNRSGQYFLQIGDIISLYIFQRGAASASCVAPNPVVRGQIRLVKS